MSLSPESKERVTNMTGRVTLMLQQRDFSAAETSALILCLQGLLDHQCAKHGIKPIPSKTEEVLNDCQKFFEAVKEAMFWLPPGDRRDTTYNDRASALIEKIKSLRGNNEKNSVAGL